jgi:signal transduction histidine kinase
VTALAVALAVACVLLALAWARERRALARERARAQTLVDEAAALAATAERERIYRDLHDDLGAKLLELVYRAPTPRDADLARAALQDLRDVVTRSRGTTGALDEAIAEIAQEARQRLAAAGIELVWEALQELPPRPLASARALHLYRIVREAISNVIRHAHARRLRVRVRADHATLDLEITDDGDGREEHGRAGSGIDGMRARTDHLDGAIRWTSGTAGGTKVLLSVPLDGTSP